MTENQSTAAAPVALTPQAPEPAPVHYAHGKFKAKLHVIMRQGSTAFSLTGFCDCEPTSNHINAEYTDGVNAALAAVFDGTVARWKAGPTFKQLTALRSRKAELATKAAEAEADQATADQLFRNSVLALNSPVHDAAPARAKAAVTRGAADQVAGMVAEAEAAATAELRSVLQQARQQAFGDAQSSREAILAEIMDAIAPKLVELEVRAAAQRLDDAAIVSRYGVLPGA
jgi:hypothetical protein